MPLKLKKLKLKEKDSIKNNNCKDKRYKKPASIIIHYRKIGTYLNGISEFAIVESSNPDKK